MHINVRSMKNKRDGLDMFLGSINRPFDVLLFTETWLTTHDDHLPFKHYQYHGLLRSNMRGGGLAVYVKSCYPQCVLDEISVTNSNVECLAVSLSSVIVAVVYRPPAGNKLPFFKFFENLLLNLANSRLPFVIMGDININLMHDDRSTREFNSLIASYGCLNTINKPTRISVATASLLDVCVTNMVSPETESGLLSCEISDHIPIFCFLPVKRIKTVSKNATRVTRVISDENLIKFMTLIQNVCWENVYSISDVNAAYTAFLAKFMECYNAAFPAIEVKHNFRKSRKPWVDKMLYNRIRIKNKMYHDFVHTRDAVLFREFKKFRNKLNKDLKFAKTAYYTKRFSRIYNDRKKVWSEINELINKHKCRDHSEIAASNSQAHGTQLANTINHFFIEAGKPALDQALSNAPVCNLIITLPNSISLLPVIPQEVATYIGKIKNNVSAGHDDIKAIPLKYVSALICEVLAYIINLMFTSGTFPDELKIARVCPIYKGGNRNEITNYRPISVLSVLSKVFEGAINSRLEKFFSLHNIINPSQYGF